MQISPAILLIIPYLIVISVFILGWLRKQAPTSNNVLKPFVSILIPVKNEEGNLPALLNDILNQQYPSNLFEVIFIDDHSEDNTCGIINEYKSINSSIKLISLTRKIGKKEALWEGINSSSGEFIITTDGDCRFSDYWIEAMVDYFIKFPLHLIIGPVFMKQKKGLWSHFQSLEFLSLIASGAGAVGIGHPILCNGANLGAHRSLFLKAEEVYHSGIASGDDIFLLLELKRLKVPAVFVKNNDAVVETENSTDLKQFINQRSRWTFKSRFYRDPEIILIAIIVLFTNIVLLSGLFYSFVHPQFLDDFLLLYLLKCFVDYILLYYVARFFDRKKLLKYFLIHQLLYLFYVSFIGIAGHFPGKRWKGRQQVSNY